MGTEELAIRVWDYISLEYDNEGSIEEVEVQIENDPNAVIEYLLNLLDNFTTGF